MKTYFKYFFQAPITEIAQIPVRERETSNGSHPMSCSMGAMVLSQGIKQLGCEVDYSLPFHAKAKNVEMYLYSPLYVFMVWIGINTFFYLYAWQLCSALKVKMVRKGKNVPQQEGTTSMLISNK